MIQKFISRILRDQSAEKSSKADIPVVATALLIEVVNADHQQKDEEIEMLQTICAEAFSLTTMQASNLIDKALALSRSATSIWEHTDFINQHLDANSKYKIIFAMWRLALADKDLNKYEEHLIRKVSDLIYVPHSSFIKAKHEALKIDAPTNE